MDKVNINNIASSVLNETASKFEVISHINKITDAETLVYFIEEFKEVYDNILFDFFSLFNESEINEIFNIIEIDFDFMVNNKIDYNDILTIKNYIKLYYNSVYYFDEEQNKTDLEILNFDVSIFDPLEISEFQNFTPREVFLKLCLITDYIISFDSNCLYKGNNFEGINSQQRERFELVCKSYSKNEAKTGFIKELKKIYQYLTSKQNTISDKLNNTETQLIKISTPKLNRSLLFEGKDLNLSERYIIANKVLQIDKVIRTLNIKDLEKYQLLAYILNCDKDNARNLMNGTYPSKDRDLSTYFNDLGLNK